MNTKKISICPDRKISLLFFYKCFLFKVSSVNNIDVPEGENKAEDKENCSTLEDDDLQILDNPGSATTPTEKVRFQLKD